MDGDNDDGATASDINLHQNDQVCITQMVEVVTICFFSFLSIAKPIVSHSYSL